MFNNYKFKTNLNSSINLRSNIPREIDFDITYFDDSGIFNSKSININKIGFFLTF